MIAAVLAGGRGSRMGGAKALAPLGGRPLVAWPLAAAAVAGLEPVVVAKSDTPLPELAVPVWTEPNEPVHPLCGLVAALERAAGPVVAIACDQPFVTADALRALAEGGAARGLPEAGAAAEVPAGGAARVLLACAGEPLPARYEPAALPVLRDGLAAQASLRATLARLRPATLGLPAEVAAGVNTPGALAAAESALAARR